MASGIINEHEFKISLKEAGDDVEKFVNAAFRKLVIDLFRSIVLKTPVDKGLARSSWQVGVNTFQDARPIPSGSRRDIVKQSPGRASGAALRELSKVANLAIGDIAFIFNNVPYVIYLEEGSSQQAPRGMVNVTLAELKAGALG